MKHKQSKSASYDLIVSIRLSENGFNHKLRIVRAKSWSVADFIRENDLDERIELSAVVAPLAYIPNTNKAA